MSETAVRRTGLCLSIQQPCAYLAGVLRGDAWLSTGSGKSPNGYLCLRVADGDFAEAFALSVKAAFGVATAPRRDERGYWLVRTYNGYGRFNGLPTFQADRDAERAAWLRGLFDSDGNANLKHRPEKGPGSYARRVAIYSTRQDTLDQAADYLGDLGIATKLRPTANSKGHIGTKVVSELSLRSSRAQYYRFATLVGSSIERKRDTLNAIVSSYCDDLSAAYRRAQAAGVAVRLGRVASGGAY